MKIAHFFRDSVCAKIGHLSCKDLLSFNIFYHKNCIRRYEKKYDRVDDKITLPAGFAAAGDCIQYSLEKDLAFGSLNFEDNLEDISLNVEHRVFGNFDRNSPNGLQNVHGSSVENIEESRPLEDDFNIMNDSFSDDHVNNNNVMHVLSNANNELRNFNQKSQLSEKDPTFLKQKAIKNVMNTLLLDMQNGTGFTLSEIRDQVNILLPAEHQVYNYFLKDRIEKIYGADVGIYKGQKKNSNACFDCYECACHIEK